MQSTHDFWETRMYCLNHRVVAVIVLSSEPVDHIDVTPIFYISIELYQKLAIIANARLRKGGL